jgi:hypothetical protein
VSARHAGEKEIDVHCFVHRCFADLLKTSAATHEKDGAALERRPLERRCVPIDAGTKIQPEEVPSMQTQGESKPDSGARKAAEHVAGAHSLLKALQDKIGEHPEIGQAIHKLETALAILEVQTGGML